MLTDCLGFWLREIFLIRGKWWKMVETGGKWWPSWVIAGELMGDGLPSPGFGKAGRARSALPSRPRIFEGFNRL